MLFHLEILFNVGIDREFTTVYRELGFVRYVALIILVGYS